MFSPFLPGMTVMKATGPDGVSGVMLKGCAATILEYLVGLFNHSFTLGRTPHLEGILDDFHSQVW